MLVCGGLFRIILLLILDYSTTVRTIQMVIIPIKGTSIITCITFHANTLTLPLLNLQLLQTI